MNQTSKINKFKTGEKTICTLVQYKLIKEESNFETNPYHKTHQTMQYTSKLDHIKPKKAKRIQAETGHDHMFNNFLSFICTLMIIYRSKHNNQKTNITCKESPTIAKNPSASVNKMKRITQLLLCQPTRSELLQSKVESKQLGIRSKLALLFRKGFGNGFLIGLREQIQIRKLEKKNFNFLWVEKA